MGMSSDSPRGRWTGYHSPSDHRAVSLPEPPGPGLCRERCGKTCASHGLGTVGGLLPAPPAPKPAPEEPQHCYRTPHHHAPQHLDPSESRGRESTLLPQIWVFEARLHLRRPAQRGPQGFFSGGHHRASPQLHPLSPRPSPSCIKSSLF